MTKTAWVFPGQGSQEVGMGADLLTVPAAKDKFEIAEKILGWSIFEICQGDKETLSKTLYTQPCLYVVESILSDLMREKGQHPDLVAGHSLGEYVALYAAGVIDFAAGLNLVKRRSELMNEAAGGQMAALMKFDREQLDQQIQNTPDIVLANDNSAEQVVISGTPEAVEQVLANVKAKRAVKLNVSGAFHSPMMATASEEFNKVLDLVNFSDAKVPVLSNTEPMPATDANTLKERLKKQMTGSVRWREIMLRLPAEGIEKVIEIGPGKVLTGLIKRTCSEIALENISSVEQIS